MWRFLLLSLLITTASALEGGHPALPKLHREYASEIEDAATLVKNPNSITGVERFRLAFAMHYTATREQIGRVLFVMGHQAQVLESMIAKAALNPRPIEPPGNQAIIDLGLKAAKLKMATACPDCGLALNDFFRIFDIRDAHDGFSGLPFYDLVRNRFNEAQFQNEVLALRDGLRETLEILEENPGPPLKRDLWDLALAATKGDSGRAIELLGILTSRDVLITRYLRYLRSENADFVRAFGMAPLQIRLIGDLTKEYAGKGLDHFSYPKSILQSRLQKNYYFWSSALVSHRLRLLGHPEDKIEKLALEFPRQYKTLRFLSAGGPLRSTAYKEERLADSKRVMHASGAGGVHSLSQDLEMNSQKGSVELESFLRASSDSRDSDFLLKSELLRRAESVEGGNRIYVYFYDFGDSRIGLSHIKVGIRGEVFEIHRYKNSNESFLRQRSQISALRDARSGALPSGILEVPADSDQVDAVIRFLEIEADANMKYSFFNKLVQSDTYNCGGIIYDALRDAGFSLPLLPRNRFLAGALYQTMAKELPAVGRAGKGKNLVENLLVFPNLNAATFSPGGLEPNRKFTKGVGYEFLQAEQKLSERTPLFSNPRKATGFVLKDYSNTGNLLDRFKPESANLLSVPTVLIPENEIGAYFSSLAIPSENLSRIRVDLAGKTYFRIFIHPNEIENYTDIRNRGPPDPVAWMGTPSSSARTFYVSDTKGERAPFAVKMSLAVKMGGSNRVIGPDKLARAVAVNDIVAGIHRTTSGKIPGTAKTWSFLSEESALLPKNSELGGMIVRDIPKNFSSKIHIPWYALIADRKGQERWVDELYRYSGYSDRLEFTWKELAKPLIELHSLLSLDNGLTTELHQQNLMLEINPETRKIEGFVLRDMDGNWVDYSLRRTLFPELPELNELSREQAKVLRYAEAQANQMFSYRNITRDRTLGSTLKYFLGDADTLNLLDLADHTYIKRFNNRFGDLAQAHDLEGLERAWEIVHAHTTSRAEKALYESILNSDTPRRSPYVEFSKGLESTYFTLRKWLTTLRSKRAVHARCVELLTTD